MAGGKLVVTDTNNNRVLIWNNISTITTGQAADLVLGQLDFTHCLANRGATVGANTLNGPADVWSDGTRLVVADSINNRVLIWNNISTITSGQAADLVLGQLGFLMNFPYDGVYFNNTQLFVADSKNNRVLVWDNFPTISGTAADKVLGQPNPSTVTAGTSDIKMSAPGGIFLYGKQLIVGDTANSRYLIFNGL
jgi:WD40 repeat protein